MAEIIGKNMLNKILLRKKYYHGAWKQACLAVKDRALYYYSKGNQEQMCQLRVRVVPPTLGMDAVAACQASNMLGHSIAEHAIFGATSQLWWPGMGGDITTLVHSYSHYHLANTTMHESARPLLGLDSDAPLDIIFVDFWSPSDSIIEKDRGKKVLTYTCCMTSFAAVAFIWGGSTQRPSPCFQWRHYLDPLASPS